MSDFAGVFAAEAAATIEGLTGQAPKIGLKEAEEISIVSNVIPPIALIHIGFSGDATGTGVVMMPPQLATALGDMMLGGEGAGQESMSEEDLDAAKEIVSNIVGAMSTTLGSQKELPRFVIKPEKAEFIAENGEVNLDRYARMFVFTFTMGPIQSLMMLAVDAPVDGALNGPKLQPAPSAKPAANLFDAPVSEGGIKLDEGEMKNISLIMDVKLPVRVRFGK
jgi:flagellar motor switch protein FliN/FliY